MYNYCQCKYFGLCQTSAELYTSERREDEDDKNDIDKRILKYLSGPSTKIRSREPVVYLPDSGQIVRAIATDKVPKAVHTKGTQKLYKSDHLHKQISSVHSHNSLLVYRGIIYMSCI